MDYPYRRACPPDATAIRRNDLVKYISAKNREFETVKETERIYVVFRFILMGDSPDGIDLFIKEYGNSPLSSFMAGLKKTWQLPGMPCLLISAWASLKEAMPGSCRLNACLPGVQACQAFSGSAMPLSVQHIVLLHRETYWDSSTVSNIEFSAPLFALFLGARNTIISDRATSTT